MALELRLQHKLSQQLVMTPQLQQAIKLLQLNYLELADVLREELAENPVLEERGDGSVDDQFDTSLRDAAGQGEADENRSASMETPAASTGADKTEVEVAADLVSVIDSPVDATPEPTNKEVEKDVDWESYLDSYSYALPSTAGSTGRDDLPSFEATMVKPQSLHEHLRWQVIMQGFSQEAIRIAEMLIDEINDDGYLAADALDTVVSELGISRDAVERVLGDLQSLEPMGVASRNLRECLLIQCQYHHPEAHLALHVIDSHLKNVENRNYGVIAKALKVTKDAVGDAVKLIATLEPRPGRAFSSKEPQYITPDIYVSRVSDEWVISLNEDGLPKLRISNYYRNAMSDTKGQAKNYIQEKLRGAAWLIRSIHMRQRTIYKVTESILKFQSDFFEKGLGHLKPLILRDVGDDVGMHESTISRVTTNKYAHTPQGIFELKYFFNSSIGRFGKDSIASESVRDHIKRLIDEENPRRPHSDQKIVDLLKVKEIDIARRTVAKYREMMKIPSSSKRKQVF